MDIDNIIDDLVENSKAYELAGVEFTEEDAERVNKLVNEGMAYLDALDNVLQGIHDCLKENWEF
jgi:hypothetical protein